MRSLIDALRANSKTGCVFRTGFEFSLLAVISLAGLAQAPAPRQPEPSPDSSVSPAPQSTALPATSVENSAASTTTPAQTDSKASQNPLLSAGPFSVQTVGGEINEDQLKQLLAGKVLYLRAGYLDNNLEFDEKGRLTGHSPKGSFTLSQIQINKVKLSKHKLELAGDR